MFTRLVSMISVTKVMTKNLFDYSFSLQILLSLVSGFHETMCNNLKCTSS